MDSDDHGNSYQNGYKLMFPSCEEEDTCWRAHRNAIFYRIHRGSSCNISRFKNPESFANRLGMAYPSKTNDSRTNHLYEAQSVLTDEQTSTDEHGSARKRQKGIKERAQQWFRKKSPKLASRDRTDSQPASHCATSSLPADDLGDASEFYSSGECTIQNQPGQFSLHESGSSQPNDDTARLPASSSYPHAASHTSNVLLEGVERSPKRSPAMAPRDRTDYQPVTSSLPAGDRTDVAESHSSLGRTMRNQPGQFPSPSSSQADDDPATRPGSILYPNAPSLTSGVIRRPEGVERSSFVKNSTVSEAAPESKVATNPVDGSNTTPNVIIFGESGVGKSSLINMITGTESAMTSNEAVGCTFQSAPHDVELKNRKYRLWDTIGLNEGERGTASPERSIQDLQRLVQNLQDEGVNLLVYCIRGSRIRDIIKINYDLFWKIICNGQVPIAVVVTGLENEEDMEDWWRNNRDDFVARGMRFPNHACVTTTKGKRMKNGEYMYEAEFDLSVNIVRDLIVKCCPETSWKPDSSRWMINIVETMKEMFIQYESRSHGEGYGSHRAQARNGPAIPDSVGQYFNNMISAFDRI